MERRENSWGGEKHRAVKSSESGLGQNWVPDPALMLFSDELLDKLFKTNAGGQNRVYLTGVGRVKLENSWVKETKPCCSPNSAA